jgi:hypothetical protein
VRTPVSLANNVADLDSGIHVVNQDGATVVRPRSADVSEMAFGLRSYQTHARSAHVNVNL